MAVACALDSRPTPARSDLNEGAMKLTHREKRWVDEIEVLISMVRAAPEGESKWIATERLEDRVISMAMKYNIDGNGQTPEGWTKLITHLSRWSMRDLSRMC